MIVGGQGIGSEGRLWLFDVKTQKQVWAVQEAGNGAYNAISFTADGRGVLSGSNGQEVPGRKGKVPSELRRWDVATGKEVWRAEGDLGWFNAIIASPDGKSIAACDGGQLMLFDPATGHKQNVLMKMTRGKALP